MTVIRNSIVFGIDLTHLPVRFWILDQNKDLINTPSCPVAPVLNMNRYLLLVFLILSISTVFGHGYLKCPAGRQYRGKSVTVNNGKFN